MTRRNVARWIWTLVPLILMILFQAAILTALNLWAGLAGGLDPRVLFYLPFLSFLLPLFLVLLWYWRRLQDETLRLVFTHPDRRWQDVGIGIGLAFLCVMLFLGSLRLLQLLGLATPDFSSFSPAHHIYFATLGALMPGIGEEIYFRGFLRKKFEDFRPAGWILITSLSFAFWHILSPSYLLHTFLIGIVLGIAVHRTQRLLPVIVAHTLTNAAGGLLLLSGWLA